MGLALDQRSGGLIACSRIGNPGTAGQLGFLGKALKVVENQLDNFVSLTPPWRESLCGKFPDLDQVIFEQEVKQLDENPLPRAPLYLFPRSPDELIDGNPIFHTFDQYVSETTVVNHGSPPQPHRDIIPVGPPCYRWPLSTGNSPRWATKLRVRDQFSTWRGGKFADTTCNRVARTKPPTEAMSRPHVWA
ncbi:hypothetical protein, partial [Streptomyces decoyicus]